MTLLVLGLAVFFGVHLVPTAPSLRKGLSNRFGENGYKAAFSVLALVGFLLIVFGKSRVAFEHVFMPPSWGRHATMGLMLLSVASLTASSMSTNLKRWTAHPMLWGVTLWASGHLLANGDLGSVLLFGSFLSYSIFDMISANRRGAVPRGQKVPVTRDLALVGVTLVVYVALILVHPYAFGVGVIGGM